MSDVLDLPGADREQPDRPPAKVLPLGCVTLLDLDPDVVLENNKGRLAGFVFVGYDMDGEEVFGSTYADGGTALWLLERLKAQLLKTGE